MSSSNKFNIIFTGGGSGGHLFPAVTMISHLKSSNHYKIYYIGSNQGIERDVMSELKIPYYNIQTGKLRRYFSLENFIDIIRLIVGIIQATAILLRFNKNTLVFSTGGFVAVPVVVAAKITRKHIFIHEQTSRIGLANKISSFFADKIFISFKESMQFFPAKKTYYSGYPLRAECFSDQSKKIVLGKYHLNDSKNPILFITGGGNGSKLLNEFVETSLEQLKKTYFIVHQVGQQFIEYYQKYQDEHYHPIGLIKEDMIDLYKLSDIIISRSGAGTVCELIALNKRSILVPLKIAQLNEQFHNAKEAHRRLGSMIVEEDELKKWTISSLIDEFNSESTDRKTHYHEEVSDAKVFLAKEINNLLIYT
ncbi:MAG: glycosyltransferase [Bacteriovoracaceae bacterium]|nr:glycosyltransferase [Bacteriovoracaceae bacterium]